jgi:hypothetical protein
MECSKSWIQDLFLSNQTVTLVFVVFLQDEANLVCSKEYSLYFGLVTPGLSAGVCGWLVSIQRWTLCETIFITLVLRINVSVHIVVVF